MSEASPSHSFAYNDFTNRNIGFVTESEQERLQHGRVFVCGVGGMGGACVQTLVRAGVGHIGFCDFDEFEISNMNRQVFASLSTVGMQKTTATETQIKNINPLIKTDVYGRDWINHIDRICKSYPLIVNGMDDIRAGILLYRKAKEHGCTIIDAYSCPLPSVTVVTSTDPRPEDRLKSPTRLKSIDQISDADLNEAFLREAIFVIANSTSLQYVDREKTFEVMQGKRKRFSYAPMVITTGNLMAYEALSVLLKRKDTTNYLGYFFNPYRKRVERPLWPPVSRLKSIIINLVIRRMFR